MILFSGESELSLSGVQDIELVVHLVNFDSEGFDFRFEDSDLFGGIIGVSLTGGDLFIEGGDGIGTILFLGDVGGFSFLLLEG